MIGSLPSSEDKSGSVTTCKDRERRARLDRILEIEAKRAEEELEVKNPQEWIKIKFNKRKTL